MSVLLTRFLFAAFGFFFAALSPCYAESPSLRTWCADPLQKVFRDAPPTGSDQGAAEVACGEVASFQVIVRADRSVKNLRTRLAGFFPEDGDHSASRAVLEPRAVRYVGYVPVDRPIHQPPTDVVRKTPADFPDPLFEQPPEDLLAQQAQPIWITVPVPEDAVPGEYRSTLHIHGIAEGEEVSSSIPLSIKVWPAKAGKSRLWVTNWFVMDSVYPHMRKGRDSAEYWELLRKYARNMAEHRQNVVLISPLDLAELSIADDGSLRFDFSRFDRWVKTFEEEGVIGRIEGGHLGDRYSHFRSPFYLRTFQAEDGNLVAAKADPTSAEAEAFYGQFFPALVKHLQHRGWLDRYVQHLVDEPVSQNETGYAAIAALARRHAPELKIIEACHTRNLVGSIDVWVPMLDFYHKDYKFYQARQAAGEEVWFYTCWKPQKEYANRFIEQPLLKTRLLHWLNFRYGATGYLHWGYNQWTEEDPLQITTVKHDPAKPDFYLPAGDAWIVYPGKEGPIDSIRHEAMRDGIADYELFKQLEEKNPEAAEQLVLRHVQDFNRYDCDIERFRSTRRELLSLLSAQSKERR